MRTQVLLDRAALIAIVPGKRRETRHVDEVRMVAMFLQHRGGPSNAFSTDVGRLVEYRLRLTLSERIANSPFCFYPIR